MKKLKALLFIGALICFGSINGQGVNLRLDPYALEGLAATSYLNEVDSLYIWIHNDSSNYFAGIIGLRNEINSSFYSTDSVQNPVYYANSGVQDSIGAFDSVSRLVVVHISSPAFIIGTSGVVIWPKVVMQTYPLVTPAVISDSASVNVYVTYPAGENEISDRDLKVYMNNQQLVIRDGGKYLLKNVVLYDVSGKMLNEQEITTSGVLNMNQYAPGVYMAEINFADNTRVLIKVLNTR